ncbi:hypothetical protein JQK88_26770 [Mesorhizobium caraganae]|nr:hypothetical protein [Mesorhizobium caraganae]
MWEALMMLRLIAAYGPAGSTGHGARAVQAALPADTLKGAIRLSFAAWRLSLPFSTPSSAALDDKKIA